MTLIKFFSNELKANEFAKLNRGKVIIKYDWDSSKNRMIKIFIVKY